MKPTDTVLYIMGFMVVFMILLLIFQMFGIV